ncbi:MAG: hypothetical protein IPH24_17800 [Crocinitomicaceae bacterium]|nr:hypothetical protein [Crocinitomicaceae bacterium]
MKIEDLDQFILEQPITYKSVRLDFADGSFKVGFFENVVGDFDALRQKNHWRFIENNNSVAYRENNNNPVYTTMINGDNVNKLTVL